MAQSISVGFDLEVVELDVGTVPRYRGRGEDTGKDIFPDHKQLVSLQPRLLL